MWLSSFKCQCLSGVHRGLVRSSTPLLEQCFVTGGEDGLLCLWRAEAKANPSGAVKVRPSTGPQIKRSRVTWGWMGRGVVHHQLVTMATTRCVKRKMHQNETGQVWSWVAWRTPGTRGLAGHRPQHSEEAVHVQENQPASQRGAIRLAIGAEIHGRAERRAAASKIELRQGKSPR